MFPLAGDAVVLWLLCCSSHGAAVSPALADSPLRTFVVRKAAVTDQLDNPHAARTGADAPRLPQGRSMVKSTVGLGYVERADWGAEVLAAGAVAGLDLQLNSLMTFGPQGARFDHGTLSLRDPEKGWQAEAGDLFSNVRGPVRGARLSWRVNSRWQPALAFYSPRPDAVDRRNLVAYRDRIQLGPVSMDGEIASDASTFFRTRFTAGTRFDLEVSDRRARAPVWIQDRGVQADLRVWRGVSISASLYRSERPGERSDWRSVALHLPVHRFFDITLERNFSATGQSVDRSTAAMVNVHAGGVMFLQRYQWGRADFLGPGALGTLDRDQLQSMAAFAAGPRLNFSLQVATQWSAAGRAQNWLELQANVRVTRRTTLQVATPMPQAFDVARVRVQLEQGLPRRFSLLAEYGRPSAYQSIQDAQEQPRFKIMLRRSWDVPTPASGGNLRGLVLDYIGRPVPGARIRLGPYTADSDASGAYVFAHVPRGDFDLSLDPDFLPADYAWDGRTRRLAVTPASRLTIDLVVAPLNAIHGRVYADANGNGRFDAGEGVADAVVCLDGRVTATDRNGAYDFYNLPPGPYVVRLDEARLPVQFGITASATLAVELREDRPVTGADFLVVAKTKAVIWRVIK